MKRFKIWSIAVAMFTALFLVSCDKDDNKDQEIIFLILTLANLNGNPYICKRYTTFNSF